MEIHSVHQANRERVDDLTRRMEELRGLEVAARDLKARQQQLDEFVRALPGSCVRLQSTARRPTACKHTPILACASSTRFTECC